MSTADFGPASAVDLERQENPGARERQRRRRRRRAVAALLLALVGGGGAERASAQTGQVAMAPAGGVVNRAAAGFGNLNANGPGWFYYGLNAADRGLGYQGSYMTLGAFIPYAEDDLGGFWAADLRSHLSNYGGFFSNVGFVRKQFWGGALAGVGVYWDYDGDENMYADSIITDSTGTYVANGGQSYNQVGVSGEFLTDWGNLRSNGYIPVGSTASVSGPYVGSSLLCDLGITAALAGADLEVGAYVPGLSDWAGMVSVGGYTFGNARYNVPGGQDVVPYFGGVYTRLDMTFLENWDFSLQANNDSYFDWTGFARLTYRMGGSRRRTVADQMEQPMMRNEHIVRAYQPARQAINPLTGSPWRVIHVDNSVAAGGTGTAEAPVSSLAGAQAVATLPYDIVFVHQGVSAVTPYTGGYTFAAANQFLVGQGTAMRVPTTTCGLVPLWGDTPEAEYPVLANGAGTAITLAAGSVVDHLEVTGSAIGISDGAGLPAGSYTIVNDVRLIGSGPNQRGILIQDLAGGNAQFNFSNLSVTNMTNDGLAVITSAGGDPKVNVTNSTFDGNTNSGISIKDLYNDGRVYVTNSSISNSSAAGITVEGGQLAVFQTTFETNGNAGVSATGNSVVQVANSEFIGETIGVNGFANGAETLDITLTDNRIGTVSGGDGISLSVADQVGAIVNANLVGNRLVAGSDTTTSGGAIRLTNTGAAWGVITAADPDIVVYDPSFGEIYIKASDSTNLSAINNNARIFEVPGQFTWDDITYIPPQPIYDPALFVPVPPQ
ncbi:MAG: hypothetical protein FJ309_06260 [Planctomycetes bacterium]|nr:hypothetical protein [Planctomycetota bacterium]